MGKRGPKGKINWETEKIDWSKGDTRLSQEYAERGIKISWQRFQQKRKALGIPSSRNLRPDRAKDRQDSITIRTSSREAREWFKSLTPTERGRIINRVYVVRKSEGTLKPTAPPSMWPEKVRSGKPKDETS